METNIGKLVGVVKHTFSITNDADEKVSSVTINIDFTNVNDTDIKSWLCSNRIIAGQRPWRKLSKAEIENMNGRTFDANTIGQKVKSEEEIINDAKRAMSNMTPEQRKALLDELAAGTITVE